MNESCSIEKKIEEAHALYAAWGERLGADSRIVSLMETLKVKIEASRKAMWESGIVESCRRCDEEEGGSCCGAGIENRYTPTLLMMNLLAGETLPEKRLWANSCRFLGERGCTLEVRHILCINYLCLGIQNSLAPEALIEVQTTTGEEMDTVFLFHEAVKRLIKP